MARRRHSRRTVRRWHRVATVGLVGPSDVKTLQDSVARYRYSLEASVNLLATPLPQTGQWSSDAWLALVARCKAFEAEGMSDWSPLAYLYAGSAYERGRQLIVELDAWRDQLAAQKAPNVPEPLPVPHSDIGLAGGLGLVALGLLALFAIRELR